MMKKTYSVRPADIKPRWQVFDASEMPLGRLASAVAQKLMGKDKAIFSKHMNVGDFVVVVNAEKVKLSGKKASQKLYRHHTGYPGALREFTLAHVLERSPEKIIERAVWGMLPKNTLSRQRMARLKVYKGPDHPHEAQVKGSASGREQEKKAEGEVKE